MTKDDLHGELKSLQMTKTSHIAAQKLLAASPPPPLEETELSYPYGRVLRVRTSRHYEGKTIARSLAEVDCHSNGEFSSHKLLAPEDDPGAFDELNVGDAVLCCQYPNRDAALQAGHGHLLTILKVLDEPKVAVLRQYGAVFPDVPPDLRPSGYYG